ncbi:M13 family metallopeptidase [Inhella sp.]|uniref:M13 family metallopeptidase n=1 Tax=Inhella sp. TaxID=1921806 RepID=UPI0035B099FF
MRLTPLLALLLASGALATEAPAACTDFYQYVNGRWIEQTELPAHRSRIGSFDELRLRNETVLVEALGKLSEDKANTPGLKHAARLWASGMDEAAIERAGLSALKPLLDAIAGLTQREQLPGVLAQLARAQIAAPLAIGVRPDPMDTRRTTLFISQSGLSLPDREDYTRTGESAERLRSAAQVYRAALLQAANGSAPSPERLTALAQFEQRLAAASTARVQLRDPRANYHPQLLASLKVRAPGFDWAALMAGLQLPERAPARFVVGQPDFLAAVAKEAQTEDLAVWRDYLRVRLLDGFATALPKRVADANFAYVGMAQRGLKAPPPRTEQLIDTIGGRVGAQPLGMLLGEVFVQAAFPAEAAKRSKQLVADIKEAMRERVRGLPWMSEPTKAKALAKLDAMSLKIGAPERWPDYTGLSTRRDDLAGNLLRGAQWQAAQRFEELGRPTERGRWWMSPYVVNAYAGGLNEIGFPAGILQPPFFSADADDATNFGGIGMVIGHEIIHHFDDRGRQFDAVGNLSDWWSPEDAAAYKERAAKAAKLYSGFEALPGQFVNGELTLGENISDLGGIQIAYSGLQRALARSKPAPRADGLTPSQAFFVNQALIWRSKYRQEFLVQMLRTDSHSPPPFRVKAPMAHFPAFATAFNCKPGDGMVAEPRLTVW